MCVISHLNIHMAHCFAINLASISKLCFVYVMLDSQIQHIAQRSEK